MQFFRITQDGFPDKNSGKSKGWYLRIELENKLKPADLMSGQWINNWDDKTSGYVDEEADHLDFPFTNNDLHILSPKFKELMFKIAGDEIQFLPINIKSADRVVGYYYLVNYLKIIDCLDRNLSIYELYTKENLLFWEKRKYMLGTFFNVRRVVLDDSKINNTKIFRLSGFPSVVLIRDDIKSMIEEAKISGCIFTSDS